MEFRSISQKPTSENFFLHFLVFANIQNDFPTHIEYLRKYFSRIEMHYSALMHFLVARIVFAHSANENEKFLPFAYVFNKFEILSGMTICSEQYILDKTIFCFAWLFDFFRCS